MEQVTTLPATTAQAASRLNAYTQALIERARNFEDAADPCLRGRIATEVYRDHPGMPVVLKRAEILARTLEQLEPVVMPEDTFIGPVYRRSQVHTGVSDADQWRIRVLHPERRGFDEQWPLPPEIKDEMRWWANQRVHRHPPNAVREGNRWLNRYAVASPHGMVNGHLLNCRWSLCPFLSGETYPSWIRDSTPWRKSEHFVKTQTEH